MIRCSDEDEAKTPPTGRWRVFHFASVHFAVTMSVYLGCEDLGSDLEAVLYASAVLYHVLYEQGRVMHGTSFTNKKQKNLTNIFINAIAIIGMI